MIYITKATEQHTNLLAELQLRNANFHAPWVFHSDPATYFQKIVEGKTQGYFIWDAQTKELAGVVNLNEPIMGIFRSAYLGYYIDQQYANKGYMTKGLSEVISHAFSDGGFHRLEANIQPGNVHSVAVVKRIGFKQEGFSPRYLRINNVWQDHERWAITAEDWTA